MAKRAVYYWCLVRVKQLARLHVQETKNHKSSRCHLCSVFVNGIMFDLAVRILIFCVICGCDRYVV